MDYITILGRLPKLSIAELERRYGADAIAPFSPSTCFVRGESLDVQTLGGITKAGQVVLEIKARSWNEASKEIIHSYLKKWQSNTGKQTLGISVYDWQVAPRDIQKLGLTLKSNLKKHGVSLRLIPNTESALNTATSHHNKLGLASNKTELLIVKSKDSIVVAESTGAQNITALATRDQGRPKRDAFVGMLPPKLALTMINLSGAASKPTSAKTRLLDPFCGTGVILQEAALIGFDVYGTDLSDKMIDYSTQNLAWLKQKYDISSSVTIHQGDAMTTAWQPPIDAVACETYLGQPFSAPPSPKKLQEVRGNCNHIISSFLTNLAAQIPSKTPLCLAVPAWRDTQGRLAHLPLVGNVEKLGYKRISFSHVNDNDLIYYREDQVVARQLLVLERI